MRRCPLRSLGSEMSADSRINIQGNQVDVLESEMRCCTGVTVDRNGHLRERKDSTKSFGNAR